MRVPDVSYRFLYPTLHPYAMLRDVGIEPQHISLYLLSASYWVHIFRHHTLIYLQCLQLYQMVKVPSVVYQSRIFCLHLFLIYNRFYLIYIRVPTYSLYTHHIIYHSRLELSIHLRGFNLLKSAISTNC